MNREYYWLNLENLEDKMTGNMKLRFAVGLHQIVILVFIEEIKLLLIID
jgi:hypothetical protein